MVQVLKVEEWPEHAHNWPSRFVSEEVLKALSGANSQQLISDGAVYPAEKTVRLLIDAYRRHFKKCNPGKVLQFRVTSDSAGWRWFARPFATG